MGDQEMSITATEADGRIFVGHRGWQAASSFITGGSASGLMLFCAVSGAAGQQILWLPLAAIALAIAALVLVFLQTGQVMAGTLHNIGDSSGRWAAWETRFALLMLPTGLALWWMPVVATFIAAGLAAAGYLLCQGKSLEAVKNVPVWQSREVVPLITGTGAVEGVAAFVGLSVIAGVAQVPGLLAMLLLLAVRWMNWRRYFKIQSATAPAKSVTVLRRANPEILWAAHMLPVGLLVLYATFPVAGGALAIIIAAFIAILGGWYMKFVIIARAGFIADPTATADPADGDAGTDTRQQDAPS